MQLPMHCCVRRTRRCTEPSARAAIASAWQPPRRRTARWSSSPPKSLPPGFLAWLLPVIPKPFTRRIVVFVSFVLDNNRECGWQRHFGKENRMTDKKTVGSVTYPNADSTYFQKRGLKRHARVWSLWALGVGAVISGHFSGWNFGTGVGGWGGLFIAAIIIAIMYLGLIFS